MPKISHLRVIAALGIAVALGSTTLPALASSPKSRLTPRQTGEFVSQLTGLISSPEYKTMMEVASYQPRVISRHELANELRRQANAPVPTNSPKGLAQLMRSPLYAEILKAGAQRLDMAPNSKTTIYAPTSLLGDVFHAVSDAVVGVGALIGADSAAGSLAIACLALGPAAPACEVAVLGGALVADTAITAATANAMVDDFKDETPGPNTGKYCVESTKNAAQFPNSYTIGMMEYYCSTGQ